MMRTAAIAVAAVAALTPACTSPAPRPAAHREDPVTTSPSSPDRAAARARLDAAVAPHAFLRDAWIAPVPELDVGGYLAFSVMPPSTGKAGELLYWVGAAEILSSGQAPRDFDRLMAALRVGDDAAVAADLGAPRLALLFLRFRALRRGVVLERADGHALLTPDALPADRFHPPQLSHDAAGTHLRFWYYDTDRFEPGRWQVDIAPGGTTRFSDG